MAGSLSDSNESLSSPMGERSFVELPIEIIIYIMEFLPLSDRISAAQVCQQWYDASRELKLHRREVVILQDDMTQAVKVFHNSYRPVLHLVLKDLELGNKLSTFWDRFCPQLLSLAIQCCDVSERTFFEVLSKCYHLELLQVSGCRELLMSGRVLETPRDVAVLRKTLVKLRELSLDSNRYLSDALFNRFVAIAPNLDCLSLTGCQISFHSGLCRKFYPDDSARLGSVMASESVLTFNNILQLIVHQARKLKKLKFGHTLMDNLALTRISEVPGLHLTVVHLQNCDQLNNTGVLALAQRQKGLRELDLSMCTRITDLSLLEVCNNLKSLSVLKLRSCRGISNIGVSQLHRLTSLTELDLSQCELVTGEGLEDGLCSRTNTTLERLRLTALNLDERIVCRLAECLPNLTLFDLGFCFNAVTDRSIQAICRHQVLLRKLILTSCDKVTDAGLTGMGMGSEPPPHGENPLPPLYDEALPEDLMKEQLLDIRNGKALADPMHKISLRSRAEREIVNDAKLKRVVSQMCEDQYLGADRSEDSLANLRGLQYLDLCGCNRITDVSMKHAFFFRELQYLNLSQCQQISFIGLSFLAARNPSIETLIMSQCYNITDNGIISVSKFLSRLKHLEVQGCNQLTDASLAALGNYCCAIKYLDISNCYGMTLENADKMEAILPSLQTLHRRSIWSRDRGFDRSKVVVPAPPDIRFLLRR